MHASVAVVTGGVTWQSREILRPIPTNDSHNPIGLSGLPLRASTANSSVCNRNREGKPLEGDSPPA